jgi:hypothetical protein
MFTSWHNICNFLLFKWIFFRKGYKKMNKNNGNPQCLEVMIMSVLDHCIYKMANTLSSSFNPDDPKSMRILQQLRSTMAERRRWTAYLEKYADRVGVKLNINLNQEKTEPKEERQTAQLKSIAETNHSPADTRQPETSSSTGLLYACGGANGAPQSPQSHIDLKKCGGKSKNGGMRPYPQTVSG